MNRFVYSMHKFELRKILGKTIRRNSGQIRDRERGGVKEEVTPRGNPDQLGNEGVATVASGRGQDG